MATPPACNGSTTPPTAYARRWTLSEPPLHSGGGEPDGRPAHLTRKPPPPGPRARRGHPDRRAMRSPMALSAAKLAQPGPSPHPSDKTHHPAKPRPPSQHPPKPHRSSQHPPTPGPLNRSPRHRSKPSPLGSTAYAVYPTRPSPPRLLPRPLTLRREIQHHHATPLRQSQPWPDRRQLNGRAPSRTRHRATVRRQHHPRRLPRPVTT